MNIDLKHRPPWHLFGGCGRTLSGPHLVESDDRFEYGEARFIATGEIAGRLHVCVDTLRGDAYRIISLRRANRRETNAYR